MAIKKRTGARALRNILESMLLEAMFQAPDDDVAAFWRAGEARGARRALSSERVGPTLNQLGAEAEVPSSVVRVSRCTKAKLAPSSERPARGIRWRWGPINKFVCVLKADCAGRQQRSAALGRVKGACSSIAAAASRRCIVSREAPGRGPPDSHRKPRAWVRGADIIVLFNANDVQIVATSHAEAAMKSAAAVGSAAGCWQ